jgi:hypothetical protein
MGLVCILQICCDRCGLYLTDEETGEVMTFASEDMAEQAAVRDHDWERQESQRGYYQDLICTGCQERSAALHAYINERVKELS